MPSLCVVTGNLRQLSNGLIAQGQVIFELGNIGTGNPITIAGTAIFPSLKCKVHSAADGSFVQALWGNDNISPSNTIYNVTYRDHFGNEVGPIMYSITGASADLDTISAVTSTVPPVIAPAPVANVWIVTTEISDFTASPFRMYLIATGASTITVTLPTAVGISGQPIFLKKLDAGSGIVNILGTIDTLSGYTLVNQNQFVEIVSDNAFYQITSNN